MLVRRALRLATVGVSVAVVSQVLLVNACSAAAPVVTATSAKIAAKKATCARPAKGFTPTKASIPAISRTVKVIQVNRTKSGAVGAGPVTEKGKWLMAMDPHTKPASRRGSVLLSGHTYPDGSALGNAMLSNLYEGDRVVLRGTSGKRACYRISQRAEYPVNEVPNRKAFRYWGREQIVIVSCSGTRLGPGNWTHRTIWYGRPLLPPKTSSNPQPAPAPPAQESPTLLGGLLGGLF